jgi:hypothetical protein
VQQVLSWTSTAARTEADLDRVLTAAAQVGKVVRLGMHQAVVLLLGAEKESLLCFSKSHLTYVCSEAVILSGTLSLLEEGHLRVAFMKMLVRCHGCLLYQDNRLRSSSTRFSRLQHNLKV